MSREFKGIDAETAKKMATTFNSISRNYRDGIRREEIYEIFQNRVGRRIQPGFWALLLKEKVLIRKDRSTYVVWSNDKGETNFTYLRFQILWNNFRKSVNQKCKDNRAKKKVLPSKLNLASIKADAEKLGYRLVSVEVLIKLGILLN